MKHIFRFLIVALMSILITACAPAPTPVPASPTPKPTETPAATATSIWTPRIAADTSAVANFPTGKFLKSGTTNHYLVFKEGNIYKVWDGGFQVDGGTYEVEGNVYTLTSADFNCGPLLSFVYVFDGQNLTFNYLTDPQTDTCSPRIGDMDNVTYTLVP